MNEEDIKNAILNVCPEMLSNDNFVGYVCDFMCDRHERDGENIRPEPLPVNYRANFFKLSRYLSVANVSYLIKYLKDNFKSTDKLCYMDYVQGYKNDCTYITKDQLGDRFFYKCGDIVKRICSEDKTKEESVRKMYDIENDEDVIVL